MYFYSPTASFLPNMTFRISKVLGCLPWSQRVWEMPPKASVTDSNMPKWKNWNIKTGPYKTTSFAHDIFHPTKMTCCQRNRSRTTKQHLLGFVGQYRNHLCSRHLHNVMVMNFATKMQQFLSKSSHGKNTNEIIGIWPYGTCQMIQMPVLSCIMARIVEKLKFLYDVAVYHLESPV